MQKQINFSDIVKDKQFEIEIPAEIREFEKILGAVFFQFGETQCLTVFNSKFLYFMEIVEGRVGKFSKFNIPNISKIVSIIKGYLLITTQGFKLWLLEVKKTIPNQNANTKPNQPKTQEKQQDNVEKVLTVESFLKQISYSSYFLREVTPNMIQLFIVSNEKANKILYVYQFTVKQKVGGMGFTLDKNLRIVNQTRKQLYASKVYYDPLFTTIVKLKNFSDKSFVIKKISEEFQFIFPICKTEEYYCLNKNYELFNAQNPIVCKKVKDQFKGYDLQKAITHLNFILLQNPYGNYTLFSIEESLKVKQLGQQSEEYKWQICFNGRLVGIKHDNNIIKVTKELYRKIEKIPQALDPLKSNQTLQSESKPPSQALLSTIDEILLEKTSQKSEQKQVQQKAEKPQKSKKEKNKNNKNASIQNGGKQNAQELPQPSKQKNNFKPTKIIGRKNVATAKKIQQKVEQIATNNSQLQKKEQNDMSSKSPDPEQKKKQQVEAQNQPKAIGTQQNKQQNKIKTEQRIQTHQNHIKVPPYAHDSPFSKKHLVKDISAQVIIPQMPLHQFISGKPPQETQANLSFLLVKGKKKRKESENQMAKDSPFKKKEESLVVEDDGSITKQKLEHAPHKQVEANQIQVEKMEEDAHSNAQIMRKEKKNGTGSSSSIECCENFKQTKESYECFSNKIQVLQSKTVQILQSFNAMGQKLSQELKQNLSNTHKSLFQSSQQKAIKTANTSVQNSINDYFAKKLTQKVNDYFKYVMIDTKKIYDTTLKFYADKKKQSIISLQNHFQQQEHLVNEIRLITSDMLACVENTVHEGEETHAIMLKQWEKISTGLGSKLDANLERIQSHAHDRSASQRRQIIDSLAELKDSIANQQPKSQSKSQQKQEAPIKVSKIKKIKHDTSHISKSSTHKQKPEKPKRKQYLPQRIPVYWIQTQYGSYNPYQYY